MKKQVMKKWVTALRSGKYKQGKEYLCDDGKYCCLGVLCDIYNKERVKSKKRSIIEDDKSTSYLHFDGAWEVLPECVREWAGMESSTGALSLKDMDTSLAELNDHGKKFSTLANTIEKHYEQL